MWAIALLGAGLHALLYSLPNKFLLVTPRALPLSWLDRVAGFHPWAVWPYLSVYPLVFFAFEACKARHRFLAAFFTAVVAGATVHYFFPVALPREPWPIPATEPWIFGAALSALRRIDSPLSCFPSLHVATAFVAILMAEAERPGRARWLFFWGLIVCASTLMTKQHYAIDVAGGLGLALLVGRLYRKADNLKPAPGENHG